MNLADWFSIAQNVIISAVAIFTAWWTFKTFAHKEKIQELKDILSAVDKYEYYLSTLWEKAYNMEDSRAGEMMGKYWDDWLPEFKKSLFAPLFLNKKDREFIQYCAGRLFKAGGNVMSKKTRDARDKERINLDKEIRVLREYIYGISKKYL